MSQIPRKVVKVSAEPDASLEAVLYGATGLATSSSRLPGWVAGDLLLLLTDRHPSLLTEGREAEGLPEYINLLSRLVKRSARWRHVVSRLRQLERERAGQFRARPPAPSKEAGGRPRLAVPEPVMDQRWEAMTQMVLKTLLSTLNERVTADDTVSDRERVEQAAGLYQTQAEEFEDFAEGLFDATLMAQFELCRRARVHELVALLQDRDLIQLCLRMPLDINAYRPRLLRETLRPGDRSPRRSGDHQSLKGITLKLRDDQIPLIHPTELATNRWNGDAGRRLTLDKILNRRPIIYQHHDTQAPELRHRILVVFLNNFARAMHAEDNDHESLLIQHRLKALSFGFLINAALQVPHGSIHVDVAWFQRDNPDARSFDWGAQFRLAAVKATRVQGENWRNLLEVDRFLPRLLVTTTGGLHARRRADFLPVRERPAEYLSKVSDGRYHGIFVAGFSAEGEGQSVVPPASLPLPALPPETPVVMVSTVGPNQTRWLRGGLFHSLLAGRMAPNFLPLVPADPDPVAKAIESFLEMIIGPVERRAAGRPGSGERKKYE